MLSNIFLIVYGHLKWKQSLFIFFARMYKTIYVLPLEIKSSRGEEWIPLICLTPPHLCACIEANIWISNFICRGFFCCIQWLKVRADWSFCYYWWNCWPSLFRLSFHKWATKPYLLYASPYNRCCFLSLTQQFIWSFRIMKCNSDRVENC